MMDHILIRGLRVKAGVGLESWERSIQQMVWIDVDAAVTTTLAIERDHIQHTADYAAICESIKLWLVHYRCDLLEHLADALAQHILKTFAIEHLTLTIWKKGVVQQAEAVGVKIERKSSNILVANGN
ncbi:MAG: dihydroneopterin aldolase [Pseudomonadota bacterium]